MARSDELRLMTRIARMYYEKEMRQSEIAMQLGMSQATISRLFNRAKEEGIVRITVNVPQGVYSDLEEQIIEAYDMHDVVVVDCVLDDEELVQRELGAAAAFYVANNIRSNDIIGISSWSGTLLALVDALDTIPRKDGIQVVQILGGVGNPAAEDHAVRLTSRFAKLVNGSAVFLPAPGIVGSQEAGQALMADPFVKQVFELFDGISLALVGIGAIKPSPLLADSGNIFSNAELSTLRDKGGVGDILLHFFDDEGHQVDSPLNKRVISMSLDQLKNVERSVGVAGGKRKHVAIRSALKGGLINTLITDHGTAEYLVGHLE